MSRARAGRRGAALNEAVPWLFLLAAAACGEPGTLTPPGDPPVEEPDTLVWPLPGGALTVADSSTLAYSRPAPSLAAERLQLHVDGRDRLAARFSDNPGARDRGLGPLFNANTCEACHARRGRTRGSLLLRLSAGGVDGRGAPLPAPGFGSQLQDQAVAGRRAEARLAVHFVPVPGTYPDGSPYELRRPQVEVENAYAPFAPDHRGLRSPRALFGLGLLEAVADATLEALADPSDADGDGVSGRVNRVWDEAEQRTRAGRFGWKANEPSLLQQVAAAYVEDMGVTSSYFPREAVAGQPGHDDGLDDDPELPDDDLASVTFFLRTLAVPARRRVNDPTVRRGQDLFAQVGCAACHVPTLATASLAGVPEVAGQTIHPYADLLLHDMGDDLADGRPDFLADGREWRTPPLWGLGLAETVQGHTDLLHDGRARGAEEAILWHGGEARAARDRFMALAADARSALLAFLMSL